MPNAPVVREDIEWLDVWMPKTNATALPRVLLIGDSITRAYGPLVEKQLAEQAYVARVATSKSIGDPVLLDELRLALGQSQFDLIHFNNGLHGWGYSEEAYAAAFPAVVSLLRDAHPRCGLIWASSTPMRMADNLSEWHPHTARIRRRNELAASIVRNSGIPIDDLFAVVESNADFYSRDGTHFGPSGVAALADAVAEALRCRL